MTKGPGVNQKGLQDTTVCTIKPIASSQVIYSLAACVQIEN